MGHYILQVIVFQGLFLAIYGLVLRRETFFTYNRIYLLATTVISFVLPFMKIATLNEQIPAQLKIQLPAVFLGTNTVMAPSTSQGILPIIEIQTVSNWSAILIGFYIIGVLVALLFFVLKLRKIAHIEKSGRFICQETYNICTIPNTTEAFTFFRTIYLGEKISEAEKAHIIAHEKVHIDQWHSIDLLFFELLKIVFWFNPMLYVFQKQIQTIHEFTADEAVAKQDKNAYYQNLLSQVFGTTTISFINTFFNHSLIKKRITMLQKSKSSKMSSLKYLAIIPLVLGMLIYTSCTQSSNEDNVSALNSNDTEVMQKIDELAQALMKNGELTDEESNALKLLTTENQRGDKIYLNVEEYLEDNMGEGIPMASIEDVPTYPGCEGTNEERKSCFSKNVTNHVVKYFDTTVGKDSKISGNQKIVVQFKINKVGIIQDVVAKADYPELEREARRVINQLPKMRAGKESGKAVNVSYVLPIMFQINE